VFCVFFDKFDSVGIRTKDLHSVVRSSCSCSDWMPPDQKPWPPSGPQTESPRTATFPHGGDNAWTG